MSPTCPPAAGSPTGPAHGRTPGDRPDAVLASGGPSLASRPAGDLGRVPFARRRTDREGSVQPSDLVPLLPSADTQEEPQHVYEHLGWLKSVGGPPILTATVVRLGDDIIHGKNSTGRHFISIPV